MANILYRRLSGPIGVSTRETGSRGMWWEKRLGLFSFLQGRKHKLYVINRPTSQSEGLWKYPMAVPSADVLIIEFGGSNLFYFGKDIEETIKVVKRFGGPVLFICDDPDLSLPVKLFERTPEKWSRWIGLLNTSLDEKSLLATGKLPIPAGMKTLDFPFGALIKEKEPLQSEKDIVPELSYIGRPDGGRGKIISNLLQHGVPVGIYGRSNEWPEEIQGDIKGEPPPQPERKEFYRHSMGSLGLADRKHKILGWRTGRIYQAIAAGCPSIVEQDHTLVIGKKFSTPNEALDICKQWKNVKDRNKAWKEQALAVRKDLRIVEETLRCVGL